MNNMTMEATKEVMNEVKEIKVMKASNENDVAIVKSIVDGTVKRAEAAKELAKIESESKATITQMEYDRMAEIAKLQEETKHQIAEWEHEEQLLLAGIKERIDARKQELDAKVKIVKHITDAATWIAGVGAFTAVAIVSTGANKEIQLEKIRNGLTD